MKVMMDITQGMISFLNELNKLGNKWPALPYGSAIADKYSYQIKFLESKKYTERYFIGSIQMFRLSAEGERWKKLFLRFQTTEKI